MKTRYMIFNKRNILNWTMLALLIVLILMVAVRMAAAQNKAKAPPKAAILPILSSNDLATSRHVTDKLAKCLSARQAFQFVAGEKIDEAIASGGYDMTKIFGLSAEEYKAIAGTLDVDYVLHGIIAVKKSLKFTGWRKDVDAYIKLYDAKTGKSIDSWRSLTDFSFTDKDTELDAGKMGEATADAICAKMGQNGY